MRFRTLASISVWMYISFIGNPSLMGLEAPEMGTTYNYFNNKINMNAIIKKR